MSTMVQSMTLQTSFQPQTGPIISNLPSNGHEPFETKHRPIFHHQLAPNYDHVNDQQSEHQQRVTADFGHTNTGNNGLHPNNKLYASHQAKNDILKNTQGNGIHPNGTKLYSTNNTAPKLVGPPQQPVRHHPFQLSETPPSSSSLLATPVAPGQIGAPSENGSGGIFLLDSSNTSAVQQPLKPVGVTHVNFAPSSNVIGPKRRQLSPQANNNNNKPGSVSYSSPVTSNFSQTSDLNHRDSNGNLQQVNNNATQQPFNRMPTQAISELQQVAANLPIIGNGPNGRSQVEVSGQTVNQTGISSQILCKVCGDKAR